MNTVIGDNFKEGTVKSVIKPCLIYKCCKNTIVSPAACKRQPKRDEAKGPESSSYENASSWIAPFNGVISQVYK